MSDKQAAVIILVGIAFIAFLVIANVLENKSINGIKSKTVGDGQHGTARWATQREVKRLFSLCHTRRNTGVKAWICRLFRVQ